MFQIPQRQYWSCMGETVLKKSQYDSDVANARSTNRVYTDEVLKQALQEQRAMSQPSPFTLSQQVPQTPPPPRFVQVLGEMVMRPLQMLQAPVQNLQNLIQQMAQNLGQNLQKLPGFMDKAMSQVMAFFFGGKKETGKDNREEKEMRERNEDAMPDLFGDFKLSNKVEKKANTGLGSGSK